MQLRIKEIREVSPTIGIIIFIGLYIYSTTLYTGGSEFNPTALKFSWLHNYWCDVLSETGLNNLPNPSRTIGIFSTAILCCSLMIFFVQFANKKTTSKHRKIAMKSTGIVSTILALFIFSKYHDVVISFASIIGGCTISIMLWEIFKSELKVYKIGGVICFLLILLNNYIYYSSHFIIVLPILQKVTFIAIFTWIIGLNFQLIKK